MTNSRYNGSQVNSPSLVISQTITSDEGRYFCLATNAVGTGQSQQTYLTVVGSTPTATVDQPQYSANKGSDITLQCSYTANPAASMVRWERDNGNTVVEIGDTTNTINMSLAEGNRGNTETIYIHGGKYNGSSISNPSLNISDVEFSDAGTYYCYARNSVGTGSSTQVVLAVSGNTPSVSLTQNNMTVNYGNNVTIGCVVVANPYQTSVYWQKISGELTVTIDMTNTSKYGGATVALPSLYIIGADTSDGANYVCFAVNSNGTGQSCEGTLTVLGYTPNISLTQNTMTVNYGNNVTIGCVVSANPSHTSVYWQKISGGQTVTIDMSNTYKYGGGNVASPSLYIIRADTSDAAYYVCFATNSVGTGQSSLGTLTVAGNIPIITVPTSAYIVNIDNSITLACQVTAYPTHNSVYWQKVIGANTKIIQIDGEKYTGSSVTNHGLTISNAQFSDAGSYYCYAANSVGTGSSTQIIVAVAGNTPNVSLTQDVIDVDYGNNVTIGCVISANPAHTSVYWQKISAGQTVTIDIKNTSKYDGGTVASPSLYIIRADTSDAANYVCFAVNSAGTGQSSQGNLTVLGIVPIVTVPTSAYITNVDSFITVDCQITAYPTHYSVYWQKVIGGNTETIIINGNKYKGSSVSSPSLNISNIDLSDTGSYYCYATNILGTGSSPPIILAVTGMNDAVPDTTVTESSGNQVIVPAILGTVIALMVIVFTAYLVRKKYKKSTGSNGKVSRRESVVHPTPKESNGKQENPLPVQQDPVETTDSLPGEPEIGETSKFQSLPPIDNRQFITDKYLLGRPMLLPIGKASDLNV
ncbi:unnamed protein product [Mytilus edulis]|uniref:Ig-like domain-containing protein n=1 Tax=Mytilus edulis TaxID=6550 RepID=A0A8S3SS82_MYTED|nr:unnamed protein product [Mytilus edulis]